MNLAGMISEQSDVDELPSHSLFSQLIIQGTPN